ncbi:MAG: twin-arginine translocase TatA/TatE family subunit [Coriobacteriia bacterium]
MAVFGLPGGSELLIVLAIILLLFGPSQLPKLAKMFGKSAKALREGMEGKLDDEEDEPKPVAKAEKAEKPADDEE